MTAIIPRIWTPRMIAERLGVSIHLVRATLENMPDVLPRAFADATPVYAEDVFERVKSELRNNGSEGGAK